MSVSVRYQVNFGGTAKKKAATAEIVEPTAPPPPAEPSTPPPTRTARMLALAYHVEALIDSGKLRDYADAARRLGVSRARMTQVSNLRWLPCAVQERILGGEKISERELRGNTQRLDSHV